jgi:hypothetical protein
LDANLSHDPAYHSAGRDLSPDGLGVALPAIQLDDARTAEIIANKTAQPVERVREWQNVELLMSTDDAISHGILHEVRPLAIPDNALFRQIILQG